MKPLHIITHNVFKKRVHLEKGYGGQTEWMYFLIEDEELLKLHNNVWNKASSSIKRSLIANPSMISIF